MGYKRTAFKGISWMTGLQTLIRSFAFIKIAILARILSPSDFGLYGIAALLLAFLQIITETGINVILVQSKKEVKEVLDSAWVISIIRGLIIFLGIIIASPFIAYFFKTPSVLGIILIISLAPLISGFINPAEIIFQKELKFKYEFLFRASLYFTDAIAAVLFALVTHSVYSLPIGLIASALLEVILSFVFIRPIPKFKLNKKYFKEILHKGKWVTGYSIFNYFGENGDNITVGKILGSASLGAYQMAYRIATLPITEISDVISKVTFPVYSKIEEDKKRLFLAFAKTTIISSICTIFLGLVIFIFSEQLVKIVLGSQWLITVPVLKVLAIFGILKSILSPAAVVFLAAQKQKYLTMVLSVRLFILVATVIPLTFTFGIIGAAYSQIISILIEYPIFAFLLYRIFKSQKYLVEQSLQ
ncbi:MAG: hypothetical protein A2W22_03870 [Candidatus Levybacteria bacterium RBG_16_35_11]|nr:MAG: hypothetical protein A2W22_03870 [Candidatus Levybacteria bacterium RBG_16_35_11]